MCLVALCYDHMDTSCREQNVLLYPLLDRSSEDWSIMSSFVPAVLTELQDDEVLLPAAEIVQCGEYVAE